MGFASLGSYRQWFVAVSFQCTQALGGCRAGFYPLLLTECVRATETSWSSSAAATSVDWIHQARVPTNDDVGGLPVLPLNTSTLASWNHASLSGSH